MAERTPERALGLPPGRADWLTACLVGAMAFLAALAIAGGISVTRFAARWEQGAGSLVIVQVPDPAGASPAGGTRLESALTGLRELRGVGRAAPMPAARMAELLAPWLGGSAATLPLPAVIEVTIARPGPEPGAIGTALGRAAPGAVVEDQAEAVGPLLAFARSLAVLAASVALLVSGVAAAVVAFSAQAALAAHRPTVELLHALGATDRWLAQAFSRRSGRMALVGATAGSLLALPVLYGLARLAGPLAGNADLLDQPLIWLPALLLAPLAWAMARAAAAFTVRRWLARLW